MDTGRALRRIQVDAHGSIDRIYHSLAAAIVKLVLGQAVMVDGKRTLNDAGRRRIRASADHLLRQAEPQLAQVIGITIERARLAADQGATNVAVDPLEANVAAARVRGYLDRGRANVVAQLDARIGKGINAALAASTIAEQAKQYFSPFFAVRRDADGSLRRTDRKGAVASWPGAAGMASAQARMVMLTETGRAHAQETLRIARENDEYVKFTLSPKHKDADECDKAARKDVGFGPGIYPAFPLSAAPTVPRHFRCRCWYKRVRLPT